jgi:pimeloyl-ACP methyl ester carboxylesterase
VVCLHGLAVDNLASFYHTLAAPLVAAGARLLLYDRRGHGKSECTPRGHTVQDAVADLCALLDALDVAEPVYLVSNSFGGLIAAQMAISAPERVAGLAMIEACCTGPSATAWLEGILNTVSANALCMEFSPARGQPTAIPLRRSYGSARSTRALLNGTSLIDDLAAQRPLDPGDLARIDCPVLGVYGSRSDLAGGAGELRQHVRDCRVEVVDGVAHFVLLDALETLAGILLDWLLPRRVLERAGGTS